MSHNNICNETMEDKKFKVIIVEDVKLELKGTEEIFRHEIPNAEVIGTAMTEAEFWPFWYCSISVWEARQQSESISAAIYSNDTKEFVYLSLPAKY